MRSIIQDLYSTEYGQDRMILISLEEGDVAQQEAAVQCAVRLRFCLQVTSRVNGWNQH